MGKTSSLNRQSHKNTTIFPDYGIALTECRHARDFSMEPVKRPYFKLFYTVEGTTTLVVNGKQVPLPAKHAAAVSKECAHNLQDPGTREVTVYVLAIRDDAFPEQTEEHKLLQNLNSTADIHRRLLTPASDIDNEVFRHLRTIQREQNKELPGSSIMIRSATGELLVKLLRTNISTIETVPKASEEVRTRNLEKYILENFREPMTVQALAEMGGFSSNRFIQCFKEYYGVTPLKFLHETRLDFAKKMLAKTDNGISEICFDSGFNDLSFFYRLFKKSTGKSPKAFRHSRAKKQG